MLVPFSCEWKLTEHRFTQRRFSALLRQYFGTECGCSIFIVSALKLRNPSMHFVHVSGSYICCKGQRPISICNKFAQNFKRFEQRLKKGTPEEEQIQLQAYFTTPVQHQKIQRQDNEILEEETFAPSNWIPSLQQFLMRTR